MTENSENTEQKAPIQKPSALSVGVQFRPAGRIYTYATGDTTLTRGEDVAVEAEGGFSVGKIAELPKETAGGEVQQNTKKVLRRASKEDLEQEAKKREKALEYFRICDGKIKEKVLPMKLVDVQVEDGGKKAAFVFYAEQRVDFRSLVKELAQTLRLRIEMRQVGARDESKHKGCMGPCGLATCCSGYLRQFQSISISMAKHQGLAPNPAKLTGMCGKLKCCLAYEHEVYNYYRKDLPKAGTTVESPKGAGKVVGHNVLKRECKVRLFSGGETRCSCDLCKVLNPAEREAAIEAARQAEEAGEERSRRAAQRRGGDRKNTRKN